LLDAILAMTGHVHVATGREWHQHPAAYRAMTDAILAHLARHKPEGAPKFAKGELPERRIFAAGSDDPQTIGLAIEAFHHFQPPHRSTYEERRQFWEKTKADFEAIHGKSKGKRK
jgi:hypothetical protein